AFAAVVGAAGGDLHLWHGAGHAQSHAAGAGPVSGPAWTGFKLPELHAGRRERAAGRGFGPAAVGFTADAGGGFQRVRGAGLAVLCGVGKSRVERGETRVGKVTLHSRLSAHRFGSALLPRQPVKAPAADRAAMVLVVEL